MTITSFKLTLHTATTTGPVAFAKQIKAYANIQADKVTVELTQFRHILSSISKVCKPGQIDKIKQIDLFVKDPAGSQRWCKLDGLLVANGGDFYETYSKILFSIWDKEYSVMDHMAHSIVLVTFICFGIVIVSVNFVVFFRG